MRNFMLALGATTMVLPTLIATTHDADARKRHSYREWRGKDGRWRIARSVGRSRQRALPLIA